MTKRKVVDFGIKHPKPKARVVSFPTSWGKVSFESEIAKLAAPEPKGKVEETDNVALKIKQEVLNKLHKDYSWCWFDENTDILLIDAIDLTISKARQEDKKNWKMANEVSIEYIKLRDMQEIEAKNEARNQAMQEVREWLLEMKHKHAGLSHEGYINWMIVEFDKKFGKVR